MNSNKKVAVVDEGKLISIFNVLLIMQHEIVAEQLISAFTALYNMTLFIVCYLTSDCYSVTKFVRTQLEPHFLIVLVMNPGFLRRHYHIQHNVANTGGSCGKVHSALVQTLVKWVDIVQHQPTWVGVTSEECSPLQHSIIGPVTGTQITFSWIYISKVKLLRLFAASLNCFLPLVS